MASLYFTAAVHSLARRILITRNAAFGLADVKWHELARTDQDWYLQKAVQVLNDMAPDGYRHELELPEKDPCPVLAFRRHL